MRARLLRLVLLPALLVGVLGVAGPAAAAEDTTDAAPGTLLAKGKGEVRIGGSYQLEGELSDGAIRIEGLERDCTVRVQRWRSRTVYADGTVEFRGADGHFLIKCRGIVTELRSAELRFAATGHGRAHLAGLGRYSLNGADPAPWTRDGVIVRF